MVDANLYDFLKANETGLFKEKKSQEIRAYVHVDFVDLDKFVKIVGIDHFVEGGIEVIMLDTSICIELNEIFECDGLDISDYKNCFGEYDEYFKES
jgi:hypothetical protein